MDLVLVSMFRRVVGEEKVTLMSCFCRTCLRGWLREGGKVVGHVEDNYLV